jgi:oxaloacetate decarboxylase alpha subunit
MLTNMESQLKEQGAEDKFEEVLKEIPRVREDLGFIPLVTPTSQIVGTQSVLNVLTGERYKSITKETAGVLKGEYGATAAPVNAELQARVLDGNSPITCRPADNIAPELDSLEKELTALASTKSISLSNEKIDDILTYALFPQIGLKFLENRGNPDAFEPAPGQEAPTKVTDASAASQPTSGSAAAYDVSVDGKRYHVQVAPSGELTHVAPAPAAPQNASAAAPAGNEQSINAPLAGNVFKVLVRAGDAVSEGDVVMIIEAMKMETEIRSAFTGTVSDVCVGEGDSITSGQPLIMLG